MGLALGAFKIALGATATYLLFWGNWDRVAAAINGRWGMVGPAAAGGRSAAGGGAAALLRSCSARGAAAAAPPSLSAWQAGASRGHRRHPWACAPLRAARLCRGGGLHAKQPPPPSTSPPPTRNAGRQHQRPPPPKTPRNPLRPSSGNLGAFS